MQLSASGRIIHGLAPAFALLLLGSLAAAQSPKKSDYLGNVALCNGSDRTSLAARIDGCTALIDSAHASIKRRGQEHHQQTIDSSQADAQEIAPRILDR